ncbi:hypothetical protein [Oceanicoccus sp. KOV_DT_Chl]|uniref:hypothetical protein n=1 Tax=Oceanicoccus sp. KOV_DT_Chl TaxID=1904639 RepID=UPI0011AEE5A4|nr:hypothetical protein [Oceanicoccus sp. KOV_DT_Chl]
MSVKYAALASVAVLISVVFIAYNWIRLWLDWYKKKDLASKALEFYLVMATICLGVSAAIWLGRAVYVDPTAERYQTITMLYWLSVSCLMLCQIYSMSNKKNALIALISVALIPLVLLSGANMFSLSGVTNVSESAGRIQILGSMGLARLKGDNAVLPMNKKDYFSQHFDFLLEHSFTPIGGSAPHPQRGASSDDRCPKLKVTTASTHWSDIQKVSLSLERNSAIFLRRMDMIGVNEQRGAYIF